jgi:hypothetical protein
MILDTNAFIEMVDSLAGTEFPRTFPDLWETLQANREELEEQVVTANRFTMDRITIDFHWEDQV